MIDDNNVTIAGHPADYLPGFDLPDTLAGHGMRVDTGDGEDWTAMYSRILTALTTPGPSALVNRRVMAKGVPEIEGSPAGHEAVSVDAAIAYLEQRNRTAAVAYLKGVSKPSSGLTYVGCSEERDSNRKSFGPIVNDILRAMPDEERPEKVLVVDCDLEGSTGLKPIGQEFPDVYIKGGVMERGNFSMAAGFGFGEARQGVFSTFTAFLEMVISEITMARLNESNVICHFSHAGVDWIADNTCHYGTNVFFADNGPLELSGDTRLYFPADPVQLRALVNRIWHDTGLRFIFSTRSTVPYVLTEDGAPVHGDDYTFEPGVDEFIRKGTDGYVVAFGEMLYRAVDAVDRLRQQGVNVGLLNKPTLNVVDEKAVREIGQTGFVLVVESQYVQTGLGMRFGTWLLERGLTPKYRHLGVSKRGAGGIEEHVFHQGIDSGSIQRAVRDLAGL
jgi:transketolase C-terminal domain/subunit